MAENLSTRQRQILEFIVQFMAEHHYPPTIREIGVNAEISSTSVVNYNLNKLETMGLIARDKEVSRGLSLRWEELGRIGLPVDAAAMPAPAPRVLKAENGRRNGRRERAERFNVPVLGQIAAGRMIAVETVDAQNAEDYVEVARTFVGSAR
jgi:SOS-response transcriptional repressor LexA